MPTITLTPKLRDEYQRLFDTCGVRTERGAEVAGLVGRVEPNRNRYAAVGDPLAIPWYVVGVLHLMEASLSFGGHLHNGDPLTDRTRQVPAGRPKSGAPPFSWEESATDALQLKSLHKWTDWSIPGTLYKLEGYNGFGYRARDPEVRTPYLWSFSNHYTRGKFVADREFSPTAVSKQCGAAVMLRRMAETGAIRFDAAGIPRPDAPSDPTTADPIGEFAPLVRFSTTDKSANAEALQRALNTFPGIFVKVDGVPGERTSDAFKKVTGHFLLGDPRA